MSRNMKPRILPKRRQNESFVHLVPNNWNSPSISAFKVSRINSGYNLVMLCTISRIGIGISPPVFIHIVFFFANSVIPSSLVLLLKCVGVANLDPVLIHPFQQTYSKYVGKLRFLASLRSRSISVQPIEKPNLPEGTRFRMCFLY